jgi:hypothetical protein
VLGLLAFLIAIHYRMFLVSAGMDFEHYYVGAKMLRAGEGASLDDPAAQYRWQAETLGIKGTLFNYPPATALLYLPTTAFNLQHGYLLWTVLSVMLIAWSVLMLNRTLRIGDDYFFLLLLTLGYLPVHGTLGGGQSDGFMLLAYSLTFVSLKSDKPAWGGLALAVGLIKFHLVLPFALVMLLRKQWRFIGGFSAGVVVVTMLSIAISGWKFLTEYPRLILSMQSLPYGGFHPTLMPNIRGFIYLITARETPLWLLVAIGLGCAVLTARKWTDLESGFSATVAMTLLTSYHAYLPDLLILLIPLFVLGTYAIRFELLPSFLFCMLAVPVFPYWFMQMRCLAILAIPLALLWVFLLDEHPESLSLLTEAQTPS